MNGDTAQIPQKRTIEEAGKQLRKELRNAFCNMKMKYWLDNDLNPRQFQVLVVLWIKCGSGKDYTWVADSTIAAALGVDRKTIVSAIAALKEKGIITREHRDGTSSITYIVGKKEDEAKRKAGKKARS